MIKEMCESKLEKGAQAHHDDPHPDHTYEEYMKEANSYMNTCITESVENWKKKFAIGKTSKFELKESRIFEDSVGEPDEPVYSIELDCAPGGTRPDDLFPSVLAETGLEEKDFEIVSKFFGNWEWKLTNKAKFDTYKKVKNDIAAKIKELHNKGTIRYGSW
jgi:hypothetical protein